MAKYLCIGRMPRAHRDLRSVWAHVTWTTHRPLWQRALLKIASPFTALAIIGTLTGMVAAVFTAAI